MVDYYFKKYELIIILIAIFKEHYDQHILQFVGRMRTRTQVIPNQIWLCYY